MIEFAAGNRTSHTKSTDCLVLGVYEKQKLTDLARKLDRQARGLLGKVLSDGDLAAATGSTAVVRHPPRLDAKRVLLVRLGAADKLDERAFRKAARGAARALVATGARRAIDALSEVRVGKRDAQWNIRTMADAYADAAYRFDECKSSENRAPAPRLTRITFATELARKEVDGALGEARALAAGKAFARDLGNRPGNVCTPTHLAEQAIALGKEFRSVTTKVLEERNMRSLGMGSLLSVSSGSRQPPKFIIMEYKGGKRGEAPYALVGKGVTFDSGGISIKPAGNMDHMKYDMSGAGSVLGTLRAVAQLELPINVVGLVPAVENLPDGAATKPGDIVTSLAGRTIEILNTDAEGRLILCDALTYAERYKPAAIIDIATLTGACVIALGHVVSGLFTNSDELGDELRAAGQSAGDRCWELPIWPEYEEQLKSNFADVANVGGRPAGSVTAAVFLAAFTRKQRWAHLDIAGTAWTSGSSKNSTGRPVPLLFQYLLDRAAEQAASV